MQTRQGDSLPPMLAQKVTGLPSAYLLLAQAYRQAKYARPGTRIVRPKRNIRLHVEVSAALTKQLVLDKRLLGLKDLKSSHYVDAALSYAQGADTGALIAQADEFRDRHLGEENPLEAPNHYTISPENNAWLDSMIDVLLEERANGLHGIMINVGLEAFLADLRTAASAE